MPSSGSYPAPAESAIPRRLGFAPALMLLLLSLAGGPPRTQGEEPVVAAPAPPPAARYEGVVDLHGDGFLLGRLLDASAAESLPATALLWQSPLAEQPFEFSATGFVRIRFPRGDPAPPPPDAWRVDLADGGFAVGSLRALDPDRLVLDVSGVGRGPLRIRRDAIARLSRGAAARRVAVPGNGPDWNLTGSARQEWDGRIVCNPPDAAACRDLAAPRRACFDLRLSWQERPDLEVLFAMGTNPPGRRRILTGSRSEATDEYRIETIAGDLLVVREADAARLGSVARLPAGPGRLRVLAFVDRDTGRLAVAVPEGDGPIRPVFDETVPPRQPPGNSGSGFGIRLLGGDVRIDALQAFPWAEREPRLPEPVGPDGPGSELVSFDEAAGTFTVRDDRGLRSLAAAAISEVAFRTVAAEPPSPPGTMIAAFNGNASLSGRIAAVGPDAIRLACPALEEPLDCVPGQLAALEVAGVHRVADPPGRKGVLEAEWGQMTGCLVNGDSGIAWLPDGGTRPIPLAAVIGPLRIDYGAGERAATGEPESAAAAPLARPVTAESTVFLKTGDSFLGTVLAGGPEGLRVRMTGGDEAVVAAVALRAVELEPAASASIPRTIFDRLLTLPRLQQSDPPTHMLRLLRGDYLRGKLVSLDDRVLRFSVLGTVKEIPRTQVSRLIWLSVEGDDSLEQAVAALAAGREQEGVPLRATFRDGRFLTLFAERLEGDVLIGGNGLLPSAEIDLRQCLHLDSGLPLLDLGAASLPYARWVLRPAVLPRPLREDATGRPPRAAGPPRDAPAADAPPGKGRREDSPRTAAELEAFERASEAALARDRRCLEMLGGLLEAESELVRRRSSGLLRRLTGLTPAAMPFRADADPETRAGDARRWRRWLAVQGISTELGFPERLDAWPNARPIIGRTLVCRSDGVQELDEQGDVVFEVAAQGPWACDVTPEGHRLIGEHAGRAVVEYDERGREVWAVRNLPGGPMSVRRLDNGNTLVALSDADLVAEYDPQGRVAWSVRVTGRPCDARRLPDGSTLVAAHRGNRIVEVDAQGQELWAVEGIDDPQTAQRLPNGNTLVAMSVPGIVREIDPVGRTVWQQEGFRIAVDAQRLPDGTTLVQEQGGDLVELDPDGNETERLPTAGTRFLRW